jgi:hypothetical protein
MPSSIGPKVILQVVGAAVALWLGWAGAALAGDGADLGSLQALLNDPSVGLCKIFNISSCPVPSTITQTVLEVAALGNNLPEMVRAQNNIPPGSSVDARNPAAVPPSSPGTLTPLPLTTATDPSVSSVLSTLSPLAFVSQATGTAQPTQLYNPAADAFLSAVGVSSGALVGATGLTDPDKVYFFYEDLFRTNQNFSAGATVAKFSFPLSVLANGTESAGTATLNFVANNSMNCSASSVTLNVPGTSQTTVTPPSAIGIDCAAVFSASPVTAVTHAIFEVAVPLLVTGASPSPNTDPAYFYSLHNSGDPNPVNSGVYTAFIVDAADAALPKTSPSIPVGLAPNAGRSSSYAICAALPNNTNGTGAKLRPAVAAYYAMATSGEMLLSAPLPGVNGGTAPACALP